MIGSQSRDVDVHVPVVVIVGRRATESVHFYGEARLQRDVGESAVLVVVIQRGNGFARFVLGPIPGIDEQDVLPAVVVIVEKTDAAAHGFRQIFFPEGAAVVFEADPRLRGHVGEHNRAGRAGGTHGFS